MALNTIDEILEDLRQGKMAVIMDDEDRENEGDLIMAADRVGAQDVLFRSRYGRGLICLTLTRERCRQLRLPLMVSETDSSHRTNFTLSIEAAEGVTTGISAHDRAHTIKTAVAPNARPEDLRQPGHIFPLGHDRRNPERRRHHGAKAGSRAVCEEPRPEDRHDCGLDPLSLEE